MLAEDREDSCVEWMDADCEVLLCFTDWTDAGGPAIRRLSCSSSRSERVLSHSSDRPVQRALHAAMGWPDGLSCSRFRQQQRRQLENVV